MIERLRADWRRELLYLGLAAMECSWLYPWQSFLLGSRGRTHRIPLAVLFASMVLVSYVTRYFNEQASPLLTQRLLTMVLAVVSSLVLLRLCAYPSYPLTDLSWLRRFGSETVNLLQRIPVSLVIYLTGFYLWWRGIQLAQRSLSVESVGFSFRLGIIAFLWLFLSRLFFSAPDAVPFAFLYFLIGLMVMGLARVEDVTTSAVGIRTPFNLAWMGILGFSALAVSGLSIVAVKVFSLENIAAWMRALRPVFRWVTRLTSPLQAIVASILEWALGFFIRMFNRAFVGGRLPESTGVGEFFEALREFQNRTPAQGTLLVWQIIQWVTFALGFILILAIVAFSIGRAQRALQESRVAQHEAAWHTGAFQGAQEAIGSRLKRLREQLSAQLARLRREEYSLVSIRKTYASLARLASAAGYPRREAETPYEYVASLREAFPQSSQEIQLITGAYVRVHYGQRSFQPQYVQQVRDAWLTIRARQIENYGSAPADAHAR